MTDIIVAKRIEDPLSDVEAIVAKGYFQIRPARPYAANGQWVDDAWSAPINMTGSALTFKLDPLASIPYELYWNYTDGRNQIKEGSEFRYVTASVSPLKWEDLVQEAGPGVDAPLPGTAEARLLALETLYSTLSGGASTVGSITDMSPAARTLNQQSTYANMRGLLSAASQTSVDAATLTANAAIPSNTLGTGGGPAKLSADGLSVLRADGSVFTGGVAIGQVVGSAVDAARYAGDIQDIPVTIHEGDPRYNNHPITQRSVHYYGTTPITNNGDRVLGGGGLAPAGVTTGGVPIVDKWFQVVP